MKTLFMGVAALGLIAGPVNSMPVNPENAEELAQVRICPLYQYQHNLPAEFVEQFCREWERENRIPPSGTPGGYNPPTFPDSGCDSPRLCKNDV
ncbi:hypothetical protein [Erythrobacter sp. F6033]|uniref:hypothetical protein n=1 Tax=Erythrobacter sp. F6033 TaxID=2926401 RepID=UPI001FF22165|nr:hypothetical protein [Erythrobacter sp. F6033]MCK0127968.1 hypothetical protein [Erythrobacter sp. F6033]